MVDNNFFTMEPIKACSQYKCSINDGGMCRSAFGCLYNEVDFLNSITGTETGEVNENTFKSFIE